MLVLPLALAACGGDDENPAADAAVDARPVLPFTPQAYCTTIQAACTAANQQYPNEAQCLATAAEFTPGASSTEMTGDTLGCRIYHAQNAMITGDVATHCPHAGPAGEKVNAATGQCSVNPCDAFCNLATKVCGTDAAPITGVTNRYATKAECMTACAGFDKTVPFVSPAANSPTFACRVYHVTNAANFKAAAMVGMHNNHCSHILANLTAPNPCGAPAAP
jgi:hypothetical protein